MRDKNIRKELEYLLDSLRSELLKGILKFNKNLPKDDDFHDVVNKEKYKNKLLSHLFKENNSKLSPDLRHEPRE